MSGWHLIDDSFYDLPDPIGTTRVVRWRRAQSSSLRNFYCHPRSPSPKCCVVIHVVVCAMLARQRKKLLLFSAATPLTPAVSSFSASPLFLSASWTTAWCKRLLFNMRRKETQARANGGGPQNLVKIRFFRRRSTQRSASLCHGEECQVIKMLATVYNNRDKIGCTRRNC